jgi:hypothetical protein
MSTDFLRSAGSFRELVVGVYLVWNRLRYYSNRMSKLEMLTPERLKQLQVLVWIAALGSGTIVPLYEHFSAPEPFTAIFHVDEITLPSMILPTLIPMVPSRARPKNSTPAEEFAKSLNSSTELMTLAIHNNGRGLRHATSIRISYVHQFGAVGIQSMPFLADIDKWRTPVFRESDRVLEFPAISELPTNSVCILSIWGKFDALFHEVHVESAESAAEVSEQQQVIGLPAFVATNLWWLSVVLCLLLALIFLRRYERMP